MSLFPSLLRNPLPHTNQLTPTFPPPSERYGEKKPLLHLFSVIVFQVYYSISLLFFALFYVGKERVFRLNPQKEKHCDPGQKRGGLEGIGFFLLMGQGGVVERGDFSKRRGF